MFTGINLNEIKKYVSKDEPDKENPTIFHLGALDQIISTHIEDNSTKYDMSSKNPEDELSVNILFAKRNLLIAKFGIRKIEGFIDPEGQKPITVEAEKIHIEGRPYSVMPDNILAMLPRGGLINELAAEILKINKLGAEEIKN